MRTRSAGDHASVLMVVIVVTVIAFMVNRDRQSMPAGISARQTTVNNGARFASTGTIVGDSIADIRVVVFSDFQCEFCRLLHNDLTELLREHPGRLAVLYRHYPLAGHHHALAAAMASECAAEQGRFMEYAQLLFEAQNALRQQPWDSLASLAGVSDGVRFAECIAAEERRGRIDMDIAAGLELAITGTPAILVGNNLMIGLATRDDLAKFLGLVQ